MVPIFGFVLLMPVLWSESARGWIYVFAVWLGLIVMAGLLARRLGQDGDEMRRDAADELTSDLEGYAAGEDAL